MLLWRYFLLCSVLSVWPPVALSGRGSEQECWQKRFFSDACDQLCAASQHENNRQQRSQCYYSQKKISQQHNLLILDSHRTDVNMGRKRARRTPKTIVAETKPGRRWTHGWLSWLWWWWDLTKKLRLNWFWEELKTENKIPLPGKASSTLMGLLVPGWALILTLVWWVLISRSSIIEPLFMKYTWSISSTIWYWDSHLIGPPRWRCAKWWNSGRRWWSKGKLLKN